MGCHTNYYTPIEEKHYDSIIKEAIELALKELPIILELVLKELPSKDAPLEKARWQYQKTLLESIETRESFFIQAQMNNHLFDDILYSWSREMGRGWVTFHPHKDLLLECSHVNNPVRFLQYPEILGRTPVLNSWNDTLLLLEWYRIYIPTDEYPQRGTISPLVKEYPYYSGSIEELEQWWKLNPNSILTIG